MTHVLVVDDREENLYLLEALLGGQGWSVTTARHGAEALAKARQRPPDLVVSDLLMPVMDGYTLLRHWKLDRQLERAPFVVYTATYTDSSDERLALDLGADAFILKPTEPNEFVARLQGVLAGGVMGRPPRLAAAGDEAIEGYSAALVRKLEEKSILLEEANQALQRDIEERRGAEEQLERTRAQLARLIESVDGIVYEADPETLRFTFVSPQAERLLGFPVRRWLEEQDFWARSLHPEDREEVVRRCREHTARRESHTLEYRAVAADGRTVWLRDQVRYEEEPGRPARLRGLMVDITEQRRAEEARRESEGRLREMAENIGDIFYSYDPRTDRLLYSNAAFERIWGRPMAAVWARPLSYLDDVHPQDREAARAALERQRAGEATDVEFRVVRPDGGTRWVHEHAVPIRDGQGCVERIVGTMRDISEQKRLEQQFLRTQRMESIGLLAGGIAHDLNNILSPILMCSDLLAPTEADGARRGMLLAIKESALRGAELIQQILSFARGVQGRRISVDLGHLARDVQRLLKDTLPKNIEVSVRGRRDLWTVDGDPTQLHQVLMNLAVNARDALPAGGQLTFELARLQLGPHDTPPLPDMAPGGWLRLLVRDTGSGI
ncbi:MAG: PAS domain-containing protein, partial [Planctomycetota bacterium]|nr:PAS domain-containing protein [Planctomycetota bacterium]